MVACVRRQAADGTGKPSHELRTFKILQDANLKLGSVLADIMGKSGRAILAAIIAGETDPEKLAARVHGGVKASRKDLAAALRGKLPRPTASCSSCTSAKPTRWRLPSQRSTRRWANASKAP